MRHFALAASLLVMSATAHAWQPLPEPDAPAPAVAFDVYKGVAGNVLETVPMDAEARLALQRANAVVGTPLSARSVALLLGVTNPVFLIGGLAWGIWSAMNIKPALPDTSWLGPSRGARLGFCSRADAAPCRSLPEADETEALGATFEPAAVASVR